MPEILHGWRHENDVWLAPEPGNIWVDLAALSAEDCDLEMDTLWDAVAIVTFLSPDRSRTKEAEA